VVAEGSRALGVIYLKDIVKGGIKERFAELRRMGIKTVMITGDNPLTAAAIAAEAGVDDFLAQATPEAKLKMIREYQAGGRLVAIIPAAFASTYPVLAKLNVMALGHETAILSAVVFNALIIVALIPLALRGVRYRPVGAARLLRDNLLIYGLGGLIVPFIGIKLIDLVLGVFGLS